jgi:hypothetical protein
MVGFATGVEIDVAVLSKYPVFRRLSVAWRPASAPTSSVCRTDPVRTLYVRSVWLKRFRRSMALL